MNTSSSIEKELAALGDRKEYLLKALDEERSKRRFDCLCCVKSHVIRNCTVIQTYWYTSPSGCTEGDYWNEGELQIICPITDHKQRLLWDSYYKVDWSLRSQYAYSAEQQFSRLYKKLFKGVIESHKGIRGGDKGEDHRPWVNTTYFDQHRLRFGLRVKGIDDGS